MIVEVGPNLAWLERLSPWPTDGFGLGRMRALLAALGDPQLAYPAIHVVGSKGKSTTARTIAELLAAEGLSVGCTTSPHVRGWDERIWIDGVEQDAEAVLGRARAEAERAGATQFESVVAAALLSFAAAQVDVAVVEAGLGGRHDATNVLATRVVVLTNVSLEHTEVLGPTREAIAAEKLAVIQPGCAVVIGEPGWEGLARAAGAAQVAVEPGGNAALAQRAATLFLGRELPGRDEARLPGRLELRTSEIRDGAHTPEAVRYAAGRLPDVGTIVCSLLADKDVDGVLAELARLAPILIATSSSNERALPAGELARRARSRFPRVEAVGDPLAALARAHELGEPVLVTGSLYLLADLERLERTGPAASGGAGGGARVR